jgi:small-conductance mechanosensitive channel
MKANTKALHNVEINEKPFQIDYRENIAVAFKMFDEVKMDLDMETDEELKAELKRVDEMTQDVLHLMELMNFNASEGFNFSKMMQKIRQARRKIKDRIEERQALKKFMVGYDHFRQQFEVRYLQYENTITNQDKRSYRIRQLTELEGFYKVINEQKSKLKTIA